jgi:hypothetical protein
VSAQTASVNRVLKPQSRAILGLMRLDFLSVMYLYLQMRRFKVHGKVRGGSSKPRPVPQALIQFDEFFGLSMRFVLQRLP